MSLAHAAAPDRARTAAAPTTGPVSGAERIVTLDIVRGFALLGIFIMNMPGFSTSFFAEADGSRLWNDPLNKYAEIVRDMLFSGKFNSMFSLLFGIGFTIQLARLEQRGRGEAVATYVRRLLALLAFALLHAFVIWPGDVLHIYAALGFGLLLLRHASDRLVIGLIALTLLWPPISGSLRLLFQTPEAVQQLVADARVYEASNNAIYGGGSFLAAAAEHTRDMLRLYDPPWMLWGSLGFWVQMTTTILLGFLVGRRRWVQRIPELMPQIRRWQWRLLAIGIACSLFFGIVGEQYRFPGPHPMKILIGMAYIVSRLCVMLFYVLTIVRLAQSPAWQRRFAGIATAGRMPLTNYLMQSLIGTAIFYGWGLGLWGQVGPFAELLLAPAIFFLVQVPLSRWWLGRHGYGPTEWLWRVLTYGQRPPQGAAAAGAAEPR
jgi:uncharacterized protein